MSKNIKGDEIKSLMHNNEYIVPSEVPVRASILFKSFFTNIGINLASKIKKSKLNYVESKISS